MIGIFERGKMTVLTTVYNLFQTISHLQLIMSQDSQGSSAVFYGKIKDDIADIEIKTTKKRTYSDVDNELNKQRNWVSDLAQETSLTFPCSPASRERLRATLLDHHKFLQVNYPDKVELSLHKTGLIGRS